MGTTRPAYDWQCDQTVVQETERLCQCRRWTVWTLWLTFWLPQGRHCRFLSVWLYCIDCIANCSALYSQALIRLFITKNIYYIFHKVQCQWNLHSLVNICCKFYAKWPIIIRIVAKNKGAIFYETPCYSINVILCNILRLILVWLVIVRQYTPSMGKKVF